MMQNNQMMFLVAGVAVFMSLAAALVVLLLYTSRGRGGSEDAYKDLPTQPALIPADLPGAAKMQSDVDKMFYKTSSDCWAFNRLMRVTVPELMIRAATEARSITPSSTRAQRNSYAETVGNSMQQIGNEMLLCPADATLEVEGQRSQGYIPLLANAYIARIPKEMEKARESRTPYLAL